MNYIYAAAGAAIGGVFRYWLTGFVHKYFIHIFPLGTLVVNFVRQPSFRIHNILS
jgi:fluoride ion exporter CrcB/FEX